MRRRKPLSVRVEQPFRGLVTRFPSEKADQFRQGDTHATFTDAQNVRFEDGVIACAPGTNRVALASPLMEDMISHWRFDEVEGDHLDAFADNDFLIQGTDTGATDGKINNAAILRDELDGGNVLLDSSDFQLPAPFTIAGWVNQTVSGCEAYLFLKQNSYEVKLSGNVISASIIGAGSTTVTSGVTLSPDTWYFFVVTYDGADLVIQIDDNTPDSVPCTDTPAVNNHGVLVFNPNGSDTDVYIDSLSVWARVLSADDITALYADGDGLDFPFTGAFSLIYQANLIAQDEADQKPVVAASGGNIWELDRDWDAESETFSAIMDNIFMGEPTDAGFGWSAVDFYNKIIFAQRNNMAQYWLSTENTTRPLPGLPDTDSSWDGCEVFFDHVLLWKDDRWKWSAQGDFALWIPVAQTAASFVMTVDTAGYTQGASVTIPTVENPNTVGVVDGQYILIIDDRGSGDIRYNYYVVTSHTGSTIVADLVETTGRTDTGSTIAAAQAIYSVDRNDSGESQDVGSNVNGPIFQILAQGDYAYIFKERSIQSIQFVGIDNGTFFTHPEIAHEGLLTRNALIGMGDGRMIFVGHREIYSYVGGPTLTPILQQFSRQMYSELDRARLSDVILFHKEFKNELWIQYPVNGGSKVLIWNYREDTATIDVYDRTITAIAEVGWPVDPTWEKFTNTQTWGNFDEDKSWEEILGAGADRYTLFSDEQASLFIHGLVFSRDGIAYKALAETQDFDLGEKDIFKYVDVAVIGLQVKHETFLDETTPRYVYIQLGYRAWIDDDITWTDPLAIEVQGNAPRPPVRVNPGGAGRFLRLRFYSEDANVPWRVSSYEIHCRPGSTY